MLLLKMLQVLSSAFSLEAGTCLAARMPLGPSCGTQRLRLSLLLLPRAQMARVEPRRREKNSAIAGSAPQSLHQRRAPANDATSAPPRRPASVRRVCGVGGVALGPRRRTAGAGPARGSGGVTWRWGHVAGSRAQPPPPIR